MMSKEPDSGRARGPSERASRRPWYRHVWHGLNTPLLATIVGGVIVAVVIIVLGGSGGADDDNGTDSGGGTGEAPTTEAPPKSATDEAARRGFWDGDPQVLSGGERTPNYEGDGLGPYIAQAAAIDIFEADLTVYTPRNLVEEAASLRGLSVVLVGRVVSDVKTASGFLLSREVRVVGGERGYDVYIGTDNRGRFEPGTVVWASGRVAAVGRSETPSGRAAQSAYFLSIVNENGGEVDAIGRNPGSRAIRRTARSVRPR